MYPVQPADAQGTGTTYARKTRNRIGPALPCTVIWYGEKGELARTAFSDENAANTHVIAMLQIKMMVGDVVAVEIRQPDGKILSSHYGPRLQKRQTAPCAGTVDDDWPEPMHIEAA